MYRKSSRPFIIMVSLIIASQLSSFAQPTVPGTRIHGDIVGGFYPISNVYRYVADFNVWFDFGSWNPAKFYFNGGVLTLIKGNSDEGFQPDRYRGTLEMGTRLPAGKSNYSLFVKHQSFHDIDRFDGTSENYEILGVSYSYCLAGPSSITAWAGNYVHKDDVDYQWDFGASVDNVRLGLWNGKRIYGAASLHGVTESGTTGRDGFLDYSVEVGIETHSNLRYFTSYQQVHDIDRFDGETEHGLLVGVRYKY